jgi:hypothetical protein
LGAEVGGCVALGVVCAAVYLTDTILTYAEWLRNLERAVAAFIDRGIDTALVTVRGGVADAVAAVRRVVTDTGKTELARGQRLTLRVAAGLVRGFTAVCTELATWGQTRTGDVDQFGLVAVVVAVGTPCLAGDSRSGRAAIAQDLEGGGVWNHLNPGAGGGREERAELIAVVGARRLRGAIAIAIDVAADAADHGRKARVAAISRCRVGARRTIQP